MAGAPSPKYWGEVERFPCSGESRELNSGGTAHRGVTSSHPCLLPALLAPAQFQVLSSSKFCFFFVFQLFGSAFSIASCISALPKTRLLTHGHQQQQEGGVLPPPHSTSAGPCGWILPRPCPLHWHERCRLQPAWLPALPPGPVLVLATVMTLLRSDGDVFAAAGQNANVWETPCKNINNKNAPSFCCS